MYECGDGRLIQVHTGAAGAFDRAMDVFGLGDEISKTQGSVQMDSLLTDRDLEILATKLPDILRTRPVAGVAAAACGRTRSPPCPSASPAKRSTTSRSATPASSPSLDDPALGRSRWSDRRALLSETPGRISAPAPQLDADGESVRPHGWSAAGLPVASGKAPMASPPRRCPRRRVRHVLRRALRPPAALGPRRRGDQGRGARPATRCGRCAEIFEGANRGKRDMAVDLKHPDAAPLVRDAAGATPTSCSTTCGPAWPSGCGSTTRPCAQVGPTSSTTTRRATARPGRSRCCRASPRCVSGFVGQFAIGAGDGNRPRPTFGNEDYYNGLLGACACLLGLVAPRAHRRGPARREPAAALLGVHDERVLQARRPLRERDPARSITASTGGAPATASTSASTRGSASTCTRPEQFAALVEAVVPEEARAGLSAERSRRGRRRPAGPLRSCSSTTSSNGWWRTGCGVLGEPASRPRRVREESWLNRDAFLERRCSPTGAIYAFQHPVHGGIRIVGDLVHLRRQSPAGRGRAPLLGEHTRELLGELGYDERADRLSSSRRRPCGVS